MLDFYGMRLKDRETGELERTEDYKARYRNLNTSSHNYLRITRILKSLGELGYEHLKYNFLLFVAKEVWENGELKNTKSSLENYWSGTLRDDAQRADLEQRIKDYKKAAGEDEEDHYQRRGYGYQTRYGGQYGGQASAGAWGRAGGRSAADQHAESTDSDDDEEEEDDRHSSYNARRVNPRHQVKANANANVNDANAHVDANANANAIPQEDQDEDDEEDNDDNDDQVAPADANSHVHVKDDTEVPVPTDEAPQVVRDEESKEETEARHDD